VYYQQSYSPPPADAIDWEQVGTRRQHLADLLDHFSTAQHIGETDVLQTERVKNVCEELGVVTDYLRKMLMRDHSEWNDMKAVNSSYDEIQREKRRANEEDGA
jgi:hypothetical protein